MQNPGISQTGSCGRGRPIPQAKSPPARTQETEFPTGLYSRPGRTQSTLRPEPRPWRTPLVPHPSAGRSPPPHENDLILTAGRPRPGEDQEGEPAAGGCNLAGPRGSGRRLDTDAVQHRPSAVPAPRGLRARPGSRAPARRTAAAPAPPRPHGAWEHPSSRAPPPPVVPELRSLVPTPLTPSHDQHRLPHRAGRADRRRVLLAAQCRH